MMRLSFKNIFILVVSTGVLMVTAGCVTSSPSSSAPSDYYVEYSQPESVSRMLPAKAYQVIPSRPRTSHSVAESQASPRPQVRSTRTTTPKPVLKQTNIIQSTKSVTPTVVTESTPTPIQSPSEQVMPPSIPPSMQRPALPGQTDSDTPMLHTKSPSPAATATENPGLMSNSRAVTSPDTDLRGRPIRTDSRDSNTQSPPADDSRTSPQSFREGNLNEPPPVAQSLPRRR